MSDPLSFTELESAAKSETTTATQTTTTETTAAAATTTVEETKPQFTDADVQAYQQLSAMGITVQSAQEYKQAKEALDNLPKLMKDNPGALLDEWQKNDPTGHAEFLERVSDRWYEQIGKRQNQQQKNSDGSRVANSEPTKDPEVETIKREWMQFKQERANEAQSKRQAEITKSYNSALDSLVDKLKEKNSALSEDRLDYIRLKTEKLAWADPEAQGRITKGNFTDIPKYFAEATNRVTAETKAAAAQDHEARKGVESRGSKEIIPAAENTVGQAEVKPGTDPIWGDISSQEIAAAYKK